MREPVSSEQRPARLKPSRYAQANGFLWLFAGLLVLGVGLSIYGQLPRPAPSLKPVLLRASDVPGFARLRNYTGRGRGMGFGHQEWESRRHNLLLDLQYTSSYREENLRRSFPWRVQQLEAEDGYHPVGPMIQSPHFDKVRLVGPDGPALVVRPGRFRIALRAVREDVQGSANPWRDEKLSQVLDHMADIILSRCW